MATSRPPANRAAKAAPAANKQRLVRMPRREIAAAKSGGWLDERVPDEVRSRLADEGRQIDVDKVLRVLSTRVGYVRLAANPESARMEPKQIAAQAQATAEVVAELLLRLRYMHPDLRVLADGYLFRAEGLAVLRIRENIAEDLHRLEGAMKLARSDILAWPVRTGPKVKERQSATAAVAKALRDHSAPRLSLKDSRAIALELMALCLDGNSPRKSP